MNSQIAEPTIYTERIGSLDFLRGVAIFGILFINIENFAYPDSWSPWKYGFDAPIDRDTRFWIYFLTQGKFYNMFALLFGVGFYIFLERLDRKGVGLQAMDLYARRLLWLFIIGIGHAYLIWDGDVLYHYAICGLLLIPFRSFSIQSLWLVVVILAMLELVGSYESVDKRRKSFDAYLAAKEIPEEQRTPEQEKKISYWEDRLVQKSPEPETTHVPKETYWQGLKKTYTYARAHKGLLYYQGILFRSLMVMIIGVIFYKQGIFKDYRKWKFYWPISIGFILIALAINHWRFYHWTYLYHQPVLKVWIEFLFTFPKELLGVGYILLLNGLYQKFALTRRLGFISNIGRTALSNYILQSILLGIFFYGYGFSQFNKFSRVELLSIVGGVWLVQIVLTTAWLKKYKKGPLESLWRKLTYNNLLKPAKYEN